MQIPGYPTVRPLSMADKPLLDRVFHTLQPRVSEFCFAGLYLFRAAHDYQVSMLGDTVIVLGKGYDNTSYFLPPFGGAVSSALEVLFGDGHQLYGADEQFIRQYLTDPRLQIEEDRDAFDYIYVREDLAALPGNRFHKKKNRVAYFTSRHRHTSVPYEERYRSGCLTILDQWLEAAGASLHPALHLEAQATAEALNESERLGLSGVVVLVGDEVKAFSLGERLNHDTAVCHFEKSDPFLEGLSQLVNRDFSRMLFQDCRYINREQDLGDQGLRQAKLSYHPLELVKKHRVYRR